MKSKLKTMLILSVFAIVVAGFGTALVYKVFSQYLFYEIYNVSESIMTTPQDREITAGTQYDEYFIPQSDYIKTIGININQVATLELNDNPESYRIIGILKDETGATIKETCYTIKAEDVRERIYCRFNFETWVKTGRQYRLSIVFPQNQNVSVTFGGDTGHPAEHVALRADGSEIAEAMYLQFIYGTYSKKILLLWFMVFFLTAYWIGQIIWEMKTKVCG